MVNKLENSIMFSIFEITIDHRLYRCFVLVHDVKITDLNKKRILIASQNNLSWQFVCQQDTRQATEHQHSGVLLSCSGLKKLVKRK